MRLSNATVDLMVARLYVSVKTVSDFVKDSLSQEIFTKIV
jgi:hypothetical protein